MYAYLEKSCQNWFVKNERLGSAVCQREFINKTEVLQLRFYRK